jgi:hypothetical protein
MKPCVGSKGFRIVVGLLAASSFFGGFMALLGFKQRCDKEAVRAYVAKMQPILSADPRFKDVRLMGYSSDSVFSPYMPIFGTVPSKADWDALDHLIRSSGPPVSANVDVVLVRDHRARSIP